MKALFKLIFLQEKFRLLLWSLLILLLNWEVPIIFAGMYSTNKDLAEAAAMMQNPSIVAMCGPLFGKASVATIFACEMTAFMIILMMMMNVSFVNRYTRGDEENGNIELVLARPVSKGKPLMAVLFFALIFDLLIGVFSGVGLWGISTAANVSDFTPIGCLSYGAVLAVGGFFGACLTAVFSSVFSSSRTVFITCSAIVLGMYLLRGVGDLQAPILAKVVPLGTLIYSEVFANNYFWPAGVVLLESAALFVVAIKLQQLRDLGSSFVREGVGKPRGSKLLTGRVFGSHTSPHNPLKVLGLTLRLNKSLLIASCIIMAVVGGSYGSIMGSLNDFIAMNEMLRKMPVPPNYSAADVFTGILMMIMALGAAIPPLAVISRFNSEETSGRLPAVFVRNCSRLAYFGSFLIVSVFCAAIMPLIVAFSFSGASSAVVPTPPKLLSTLSSVYVFLPGSLIFLGLAALGVGLADRGLKSLGWLYLFVSFAVSYFGQLMNAPEWVAKLSPYGWLPKLPIDSFTLPPVMILSAVSLIFIVLGLVFYTRRDLLK